jgi:hypothetical protein
MVRIVLTYLLILFLGVAVAQEARVAVFETQLKGDVYSPSFYKESLVVCSNQKDRFIKTVLDNQHTEPADIYVLDANGNYERFDETFRTNYNDGPASFNKEANFLVISRNVKVDQKLGLFQSTTNKLGYMNRKKIITVGHNRNYYHLLTLPIIIHIRLSTKQEINWYSVQICREVMVDLIFGSHTKKVIAGALPKMLVEK